MKNQFLRPNGVENVSNMSQSVWNIIIDHQKHILDLRKSHKGRLKKSGSNPRPKKIPIFKFENILQKFEGKKKTIYLKQKFGQCFNQPYLRQKFELTVISK